MKEGRRAQGGRREGGREREDRGREREREGAAAVPSEICARDMVISHSFVH